MRRYAIFFVSIPVALVCARLGMWQLSRLHQRRVSNAAVAQAMSQPPASLNAGPAQVRVFQSVKASGTFDYYRQLVVDDVSQQGMPGVIVVTPLLLGDSIAVLVERGWVPSPDAHTVDVNRLRETDSSVVEGVTVDPAPNAGFSNDTTWPLHVQRPSPGEAASFYRHFYRVLPYVVRRTNPPALSALRPVPLPELSDGPHLGYAFQWFAFAMIALVGSFFISRREERRKA